MLTVHKFTTHLQRALRQPLLLALFAACLWQGAASAATIQVKADGTGDFPDIQSAVNAASAGDTINLAAGTYSGSGNCNIDTLGKAIAIVGAGNDQTIITLAVGGVSGFLCYQGETSATVIDSLQIRNGSGTGHGGAIYISGSAPTIKNCWFTGNQASSDGGAISALAGSDPTVSNCLFSYNTTPSSGGALAFLQSSGTVQGCVIEGCQADLGGGIYAQLSTVTVDKCQLNGNTGTGGGVYAEDSTLTLSNTILNGNNGPAVNIHSNASGSTSTLVNDAFMSNTSSVYAADIFEARSSSLPFTATVDNCSFSLSGIVSVSTLNLPATATVYSNCVWYGESAGVFDPSSLQTVQYCDVQGGYPGTGNFDADPLYIYPASYLAVAANSPVIDAGTLVATSPTTDIAGNPRGTLIDIGAYELQTTATALSIRAPATAAIGFPVTVQVYGVDASGHQDPNYSGSISVTAPTDSAAVNPPTASLSRGGGSFSLTLNTGGTQTIQAQVAGGGFTATTPIDVSYGPPGLTSLHTMAIAAGSPSFILYAAGVGFAPGRSFIVFNGNALPARLNVTGSWYATIPAADIATPGSVSVALSVSAPGGGTSGPITFIIGNPVPTITLIAPNSGISSGGVPSISVTGTNFVPTSVVRINGPPVATTYVSSTSLTAVVPTTLGGGAFLVKVVNPAPLGGSSGTVSLSLSNPVPTISSLHTTVVPAGSPSFVLYLNGTGFVPGQSQIQFGSDTLPALLNVTGNWYATIPAADIASPGTVSVSLSNPSPGGGMSSALTFTVGAPVPVVASVSPASVVSGALPTLTVYGSSFTAASVVRINGSQVATTFVDSGTLTVTVPAALVGGAYPVTVVTPGPGGGTSNSGTLTVTNPTPVLTSLHTMSAAMGSGSFVLYLQGTGFVPGVSQILFGSDVLAANLNVTGQWYATIPSTDLTTAGPVSVSLSNPSPGGGTSNALTFTVR